MIRDQHQYWDKVADKKIFSHPFDWPTFETHFSESSKLLDYGCGYGRTLAELNAREYINLSGVDYSKAMIDRARGLLPQINFIHNQGARVPREDETFEGILLFAVLTCIPEDEDQRALVNELYRLLIPGGMLYMSDLLLGEDARNLERYKKGVLEGHTHGCFRLAEGAICRHHPREWFEELFEDFDLEYEKKLEFTTMNGNKANGLQMWWRKPD